jgi:hypothetical protein
MRTLTPDILEALTFREMVWGEAPPESVNGLLPSFFNELLDELPWWNRDWRVTAARTPRRLGFESDDPGHLSRISVVAVPGTASHPDGRTLLFSGTVRFTGDRLLAFDAKIGDRVITPAVEPADKYEPHPFGAVLTRLMENRELAPGTVARRTFRAQSTIRMAQAGYDPHRVLVAELAKALGLDVADLLAVAGLDAEWEPDE